VQTRWRSRQGGKESASSEKGFVEKSEKNGKQIISELALSPITALFRVSCPFFTLLWLIAATS
jgi:hypothetical protein